MSAGEERRPLLALLVRLGVAMIRSGDSVEAIQRQLQRIAERNGGRDVQIVVLPTLLMLQMSTGDQRIVEVRSAEGDALRLDQISVVYDVARRVEHGLITAAEALNELRAMARSTPRLGPVTRVLGHGVLTVGLTLLLAPSLGVLGLCAVLGVGVGALKLSRLPSLNLVFPVLAAFLVSVVVFSLAKHGDVEHAMRTLVPPLVTFLPGGVLTIATVELASNQVISGASRLLYGIVQLFLLAFGILMAASLIGVPELLDDRAVPAPVSWVPWVGVLVFGVGVVLHLSAPLRSAPWILLVLVVAHAAQAAAAHVFDPSLSGLFGALALTPVVFAIAQAGGPPAMVTFLPGFWLLVPGATSLLGVAERLGGGRTDEISRSLVGVLGISLGVLLGTALYRSALRSLRQMSVPWLDADDE